MFQKFVTAYCVLNELIPLETFSREVAIRSVSWRCFEMAFLAFLYSRRTESPRFQTTYTTTAKETTSGKVCIFGIVCCSSVGEYYLTKNNIFNFLFLYKKVDNLTTWVIIEAYNKIN